MNRYALKYKYVIISIDTRCQTAILTQVAKDWPLHGDTGGISLEVDLSGGSSIDERFPFVRTIEGRIWQ
ncbi:hypothetical protein D8Y22_11725 [Salinadaptatus halalkaliphilus]|uniref:Uncharacterized protein n=1 Tax=Salinadaptatus halalkaliphilus TaxID=2419781 RepID=A0A4S3TKU4_9EURY|nr:hypothetical protein D8Y22_11725 [Salinadaptatus halalkaliphilus]